MSEPDQLIKRLKRDIKLGRKGVMDDLRQKLTKVIDGLMEGTTPANTAQQVHITADRIVRSHYADVAVAKQFGNQLFEKSKELMRQI